MTLKKCVRCDKNHERKRSRFCSNECFIISKDEILYKKCNYCNNSFMYKLSDKEGYYSYKKIFCSRRCSSNNANKFSVKAIKSKFEKSHKNDKNVTTNCIICNKEFNYILMKQGLEGNGKYKSDRLFCSKVCSAKYNLTKINVENIRKAGLRRKGKTFNEFYGVKRANEIKLNLKKSSYMTKLKNELGNFSIVQRLGDEKGNKFKKVVRESLKKSLKNKGCRNPAYGKIYYPNKIKLDYVDHIVRSSWEKRFVNIMLKYEVEYKYECETFKLGGRWTYTPDFFIPKYNMFIEVKGACFDLQVKKMKLFNKLYPNYLFIIIGSIRRLEKIFDNFDYKPTMIDYESSDENIMGVINYIGKNKIY